MSYSFSRRKRTRRSFGRVPSVAPMPNLIEVQKSSYEKFLQMDIAPDERIDIGIHVSLIIVSEKSYARATSFTAISNTINTASRLETMTKEFAAQLVIS